MNLRTKSSFLCYWFTVLWLYSGALYAQMDSLPGRLSLSGYIETYYIYDFGNPASHTRPDFLYSFHRHNEVNLNFGFVGIDYTSDRIRGKLALMAGTYANANLADEPGVLKNVFEANAGVKISSKYNLWADAGIFAAHIGLEGAVGAECWNMTRSLSAEGSPYYLSGVKLTYQTPGEQWLLSILYLNGWQRIQRVPCNQTPAFGHQIAWTPNEKVIINSSSFIGSDSPDSTRQMRYFHNLCGKFQLHPRWGLIAGLDVGAEQKAKGSTQYHIWYTPQLILRYTPLPRLAFAARGEYYADRGEVIVSTGTPNGFQTFGYSLNMDIRVAEKVLWRMEGRTFNSPSDRIFTNRNQEAVRSNYFAGTSLSLTF